MDRIKGVNQHELKHKLDKLYDNENDRSKSGERPNNFMHVASMQRVRPRNSQAVLLNKTQQPVPEMQSDYFGTNSIAMM